MRFKQIGHTADIGIVAYGKDLNKLFENAAFGMFSVLTDISLVKQSGELKVKAAGMDRENLLVNWLNELLYQAGKRKMLFSGFRLDKISQKNGKYFLDVGTPYGVNVMKPWSQVSMVRLDGAPHGAHIIPEE